MNKYDIVLNLKGTHLEHDEEDTVELYTEGKLICEDDTYTIEFDESGITGVQDTLTQLTIDGDRIWFRHKGERHVELMFTKKHLFEAAYKTPDGLMQMSVLSTLIKSDISAEKGRIDLEYVIQAGDQSALNRLNIDYRQRN
jgi:uncharacterized beta-barrel protein YwiB (DUF1934 family)